MAGQLVAGGQRGVSGHSWWGRCWADDHHDGPWVSTWCPP